MSQIPQAMNQSGAWTLLDEKGGSAVTFTSFVRIGVQGSGKALSYPIEEGSFVNYNKIDDPFDIRVTLAQQGSESDFEYTLSKLDEYRREAVKLTVSTPAAVYKNMTLQSYGNDRSQETGAGMLQLDLVLVEVRETQSRVSTGVITSPKNPTSASKVNIGKRQMQEPNETITAGLGRG